LKEIIFPSHFRISGLGSLLEKWEEARAAFETEVLFDLRNVYYFTPFAACFLAALIDDLTKTGQFHHLRVLSPKRKSGANQFKYFGLREYILDLDEDRKKSQMVPTVPLQWLTHPNYDLAFQLAKLVSDSLGSVTKDSLYAIQLGLKELLQNAFEHAESEFGVYVCAGGIKTRRVVRICVLDRGVGIRHHLTQNPKYEKIRTDEEAIRKCIRRDVTGVSDRLRGLGLYLLSRIVEDSEGQIVIASGNSLITFEGREVVSSKKLVRKFSGTIVEVLLRANKQYRFKLDNYEEDILHERD